MDHVRLDDLPDVLTVEQARRVLPLGRNTLYEAIAVGRIRAVRIGRRLLVPKQAIIDLLEGKGEAGAAAQVTRQR